MDFKLELLPGLWKEKEVFILLMWDTGKGWIRASKYPFGLFPPMFVDEATLVAVQEQYYAELTETTTEHYMKDLERLAIRKRR